MDQLSPPDFLQLATLLPLLRKLGLCHVSDATLAQGLHFPLADFTVLYPDRATLVQQVVQADLEKQKHDHQHLYQQYPTAVERLYSLIYYSLQDLRETPADYFPELQTQFPQAWEVVMNHLATYSSPQLQQLLNDGIRQRLFRSDININLVTKILLEQVNMLLNPHVFPPDRYNMAEVFRSIFLYYIRGLCTEEGARVAAEHFAKL